MSSYEYTGEGELIVPFTLDGPRHIGQGDTVTLADDDVSLDDHPLFVKVGTPGPTSSDPAPVPDPAPAIEPAPTAEPDVAPAEPTADPAAGQE